MVCLGGDAYTYFDNQNFYEPLTDKVKNKSIKQIFKSTFIYDIYHFYKYRVLSIKRKISS